MKAPTKLYTAEDLWQMPTDEPWEIWDGELRKVPGAGSEASSIAGIVFALLWPCVRAGNLGMLTGADGTFIMLREPETVVVPDVAFVRRERLPGGARPKGYAPMAPDLAVELRSPSDRLRDIAAKLALYRRAGVPLVWWVDPARRSVAVYRNGQLAAEAGEGDELDGGDVLPGCRLPVAEIFA